MYRPRGPVGKILVLLQGRRCKTVSERVILLESFSGRDVDDISQAVTSTLKTEDEDQLDALDELYQKLSKLQIVVAIRRRLFELVHFNTRASSVEKIDDWVHLARRLGKWAIELICKQVMRGAHVEYSLARSKNGQMARTLYERSLRIQEIYRSDTITTLLPGSPTCHKA